MGVTRESENLIFLKQIILTDLKVSGSNCGKILCFSIDISSRYNFLNTKDASISMYAPNSKSFFFTNHIITISELPKGGAIPCRTFQNVRFLKNL